MITRKTRRRRSALAASSQRAKRITNRSPVGPDRLERVAFVGKIEESPFAFPEERSFRDFVFVANYE